MPSMALVITTPHETHILIIIPQWANKDKQRPEVVWDPTARKIQSDFTQCSAALLTNRTKCQQIAMPLRWGKKKNLEESAHEEISIHFPFFLFLSLHCVRKPALGFFQ